MFPSSCSPSSRGSGSSSCLAAMRVSTAIISGELRVGIPGAGEISGARAGADVVQDEVVPSVGVPAGHLRIRVVEVPERQRVGGARLLAGGLHVAVVDPLVA